MKKIYIITQKSPKQYIMNYADIIRYFSLGFLLYHNQEWRVKVTKTNNLEVLSKKNIGKLKGFNNDKLFAINNNSNNNLMVYSFQNFEKKEYNINATGTWLRGSFDKSVDELYLFGKYSKIFLLKQSSEQIIEIPIKLEINGISLNNKKFIFSFYDRKNKKSLYQLFELNEKRIYPINIVENDWAILDNKGLKLLAHKDGTGAFYFIDIELTNDVYEIGKIVKIHDSSGLFDENSWDKENNKIYFYNKVDSYLQDHLTIYEYSEDLTKKNTFELNIY